MGALLLLLGHVFLLEAPPAPQEAAVLEHVVGVRVQGPVAALARFLVVAGHLDEALVEREVVADAVLPALLVLPVEGEAVHDELVDAVQGDLLLRRVLDGHGDESDVAVGRFHQVLGRRGLVVVIRRVGAAHARAVLLRVARVDAHGAGHASVAARRAVVILLAQVGHHSQGVGVGHRVARLHAASETASHRLRARTARKALTRASASERGKKGAGGGSPGRLEASGVSWRRRRRGAPAFGSGRGARFQRTGRSSILEGAPRRTQRRPRLTPRSFPGLGGRPGT